MKRTALFLLIVFISGAVKANMYYAVSPDTITHSRFKNSVYYELLGNGVVSTINYDRVVIDKLRFALTARLGVFYVPPSPSLMYFNWIEKSIVVAGGSALIGNGGSWNLELGVTTAFIWDNRSASYDRHDVKLHPSAIIGARYQSTRSKKTDIFFKVTATPLILPFSNIFNSYSIFWLWGGISFGISF